MKAPAFMFYTGDFLSSPDVQLMEAHEVGAYCLLLFNSWQSDRPGYLPDDEHRIRRIARLTTQQWADSRELLLGKFPPAPNEPTLRHNPRLVREAVKQAAKRERLAANGRKGGRPEKQLPAQKNQLVSENPPAAPEARPGKLLLSSSKQKLSAGKELPPKAKAIEKASIFSFTTSDEVGERAAATAPTRTPRPGRKIGVLPTLTDVQTYAADQHPGSPEAQAEAGHFFDHFESNGWRVGGKTRMVDWRAAFRSWMRRCPRFQTAGRAGTTSTPPAPARARTAPRSVDPTRWS